MASPILKDVGICWKRHRTNRTPTHGPLQMLSCEAVNMSLHKRRTSMVPWYDILRSGTIAMKYSLHFRGHGVMVQWPLWQWFQIAEMYQCMSMQCQYLFTSPPVFYFSDVSHFHQGWLRIHGKPVGWVLANDSAASWVQVPACDLRTETAM